MSGHSHFATIKHKKGIEDAKRGKVFSKMSRLISIAAKDGGDPESNSRLRQAIDEAKSYNMPKENIERAIKRGSGELEGETLEEVTYEAIGPAGVSIIIEGITDNHNRALSDIRQILQKHNSKLADEGSMKWLFEKKGIILINVKCQMSNVKKEDLELTAIKANAEDMEWGEQDEEEFLELTTKPEELEIVKKNLEARDVKIESSELGWVAKEKIEISPEDMGKCRKLFDDLNDDDTAQRIYSNLKS